MPCEHYEGEVVLHDSTFEARTAPAFVFLVVVLTANFCDIGVRLVTELW